MVYFFLQVRCQTQITCDKREWLSWWSTTLPRLGSRVRVPSRALIYFKLLKSWNLMANLLSTAFFYVMGNLSEIPYYLKEYPRESTVAETKMSFTQPVAGGETVGSLLCVKKYSKWYLFGYTYRYKCSTGNI